MNTVFTICKLLCLILFLLIPFVIFALSTVNILFLVLFTKYISSSIIPIVFSASKCFILMFMQCLYYKRKTPVAERILHILQMQRISSGSVFVTYVQQRKYFRYIRKTVGLRSIPKRKLHAVENIKCDFII